MKRLKSKIVSFRFVFILFGLLMTLSLSWSLNAGEGFINPSDPPNAEYMVEGKVEVIGNLITTKGTGTISFKNTASIPLSVIGVSWSIDSNRSLEVSFDGVPLELLNSQWGLSLRTPLYYKLPQELKPNKKMVF